MLSHADIQARLNEYTYRRGWQWSLEHDPWEGAFIRFLVEVPDSITGAPVTLGINSYLPPMETLEQLDLWFQWRVWRIEGHEAREYLQRDGRPVFDPHATEATHR